MSTGSINIEKDINIHLENKRESRTFFWFIWTLYAVVCMTKNCYNGALASIVSEGVLSKSQTGFITAMFYLSYTPLQMVGGVVSDKYSPERMIKIGLIGAAIANTVIFFNQNYYVMLAAWIFNGMIQFGIWPSVFKIVSSQLVRSDRTQMTFYISFSNTAGLILSYLIAAFVPRWEHNFAISAASLLAFAFALHIFEKHLNPYMKWDKDEKNTEKSQKEQKPAKVRTLKIFLASGFFFVLISTVLTTIVSQSRSNLSSVMFIENYDNVSPYLGNILTVFLTLSGLVGAIIARKTVSRVKNEIAAIALIHVLMIPLLAVCVLVGKIPMYIIVILLCVVASLESVIALLRNYYNMHFARYGKSGTAAGFLNAGLSLSYMLAAYVMPLIVEKFSWQVLIGLWPVLIFLSVVILILGIKKFKNFVSNIMED